MTIAAAELAPISEDVGRVAAPYPRHLVLDWTDYCNAKCFFCYREKYEKEIGGMGGFIPFAQLKKLENVFSRVKTFGLSSGIGEPLLHPELEEFLSWLYGINPSILLQVVTNGTTLTADKAAWFAGHLDWLSVSLNAANGEAHMRDMFPHLGKRGINAEKRWQLHVRHLTEFLAALSAQDRARVKFQMVTHRYNVQDVTDFVRLIHGMGGSQVVITNIAAHPDTIDWSLYWIKDQYNDAVDEACDLGTRLGVQVHAAKFYSNIKPVFDLDKVCRDPLDIAYISRSSHASPCCHWTEAQIPVDYYNNDLGFENYWNSDLLRRLRNKRDFASCRVCGMSRIFDETSFHFSPLLKRELIKAGKLSDINRANDYPDAGLVRACMESKLDLPSIRRTLLALNVPLEMAANIETEGLAALPVLEDACWKAFLDADLPVSPNEIAPAGPFLGIGWGVPIHEPQNKISARWIGGAQMASIFVRADASTTKVIRLTIHHAHPADLEFRLEINSRGVAARSAFADDGRKILFAVVPSELMQQYGGRLWVRISHADPAGQISTGHASLMCFELCDAASYAAELERAIVAKDELIDRQARKITANDQLLIEKVQAAAAKDELLSEQVQITAAKEHAVQQQARVVALKDSSIQQQALRIVELEDAAVAQQAEIRQLRDCLEHQTRRQAQLEQDLQCIYSSLIWRIMAQLRKFRLR